MTDFIWYVPGCMVGPVILAACAGRILQISRQREHASQAARPVSRVAWIAAGTCLALVGTWMVGESLRAVQAEPSWHRYLALSKILAEDEGEGDGDNRYETLQSIVKELADVVQCQPDHPRAHARLAGIHLELFEAPSDSEINPLGIKHVRDAVAAQPFELSDALYDWLSRAFPDRYKHLDMALQHARRAVQLYPLQGECYLHLASLSFLEGPGGPGKTAYVDQAMKVRPHEGSVLLVAGQEALLAGDVDEAFRRWKDCFHAGGAHQDALLKMLVGRVPASVFLDTFEPDLKGLRRIVRHYAGREGLEEEFRMVLQRFAQASVQEALSQQESRKAANHWTDAADAYRSLENTGESLRCFGNALRADSGNFRARRILGAYLLKLEEYDEALKHLRWCLQRKPKDRGINALVEKAVKARLRLADRPLAENAAGTVK